MQVSLAQQSWLNLVNLLEFKGTYFWDAVEFPDIQISPDDKYITVDQQTSKRLDLIAFDYYGDVNVDWVIKLANNIDLPNQIREGMVLRLPAQSTIDQLLQAPQ